MKGPRSRHRFNVLRVWECSQCKKRVFAPPQVVTITCECLGKDRPIWMTLIEATKVRAPKPEEPPCANAPV